MFVHLLNPKAGPPLELTRINVVVGANQSGKSTLLRDVYRLATGRNPFCDLESVHHIETGILEDMQYGGVSEDEDLSRGPANPIETDATAFEGLSGDLQGIVRASVHHEAWNIIKRPVLHARSVLESELPDVMMLRTVYLDEHNLDTAACSTTGRSPLEPARNLLQSLHHADEVLHAELDAAFAGAFPPLGLRLDDSEAVRLNLRVAKDFPDDHEWHSPVERAEAWSELQSLDDAGRGARNFAALALAVLLLRGRIVIADEPDAALEPFAARQLGRWLATAAVEYHCQVLVSARTSALLAGIQERSNEVTVLHSRWRAEGSQIGAASPEFLKAVAKTPVLSMGEAIRGLRHNGVILVDEPLEAAALSALNDHRGGADRRQVICVHDLAAAAPLLRLYREAGVPAAVITRLTHLADRDTFQKLLEAACRGNAPSNWLATRDQLARHVAATRATESAAHTEAMEQMLDQLSAGQSADDSSLPAVESEHPWARVQREGLAAIPVDQRSWVEQLLEELKSAGIFITPHGSLQQVTADKFNDLMKAIHSGQTPDRMAITLTEVSQYLRHS